MTIIENTTIHHSEPESLPFILNLAPELIDLILSGGKVTTYRYGNKYDYLNIGDKINIRNTITKEFATNAIIIDKYFLAFKDIPINQAGHESYRDREHMRQVFNGYYKFLGKPISDNDQFLVLQFKRIQ